MADSIVGNEILRGISGGEKRRVSIGCEIVAGHSLIVADCPTSGLDAGTAFDLIQTTRLVRSRVPFASSCAFCGC